MRVSQISFKPGRFNIETTTFIWEIRNQRQLDEYIREFGDVEAEFDRTKNYWVVPEFKGQIEAYEKSQEERHEIASNHCNKYGSN